MTIGAGMHGVVGWEEARSTGELGDTTRGGPGRRTYLGPQRLTERRSRLDARWSRSPGGRASSHAAALGSSSTGTSPWRPGSHACWPATASCGRCWRPCCSRPMRNARDPEAGALGRPAGRPRVGDRPAGGFCSRSRRHDLRREVGRHATEVRDVEGIDPVDPRLPGASSVERIVGCAARN